MLLKNKFFILLSGVLMSYTVVTHAQSITYQNQRGSILKIEMHPKEGKTGSISGTFTTAVGNCKEDMGVPMPISGFFNGNAISLSVNFPHCKQVVAMTGHFVEENKGLATLWLDAMQSTDPMKKDWTANIVGADFYHKN